MITFDLIALLMTILIVVILLFFGVVWKLLDDIKEWQKSQYKKLDFINTQIAGIWRGQDKIENNVAILSRPRSRNSNRPTSTQRTRRETQGTGKED